MKYYLFCFTLIFLVSCNKSREKNSCPEISADKVPAAVTRAFHQKYPNASVEKWYNTDNSGYTASFSLNGVKVHSLFDKDGSQLKEELREKDEYVNKDPEENDEEETGCDCESKDQGN